MFDGSFKSSRKVNLSGRKKPTFASGATASSTAAVATPGSLSKDELLLQSKLLREERVAHRKRMAASTKIQAMYRRVATTRRVRSRVFSELEAELAALVGSTGAPTTLAPTSTLQVLVRKFLVVYGKRGREEGLVLAREITAIRLGNAQNYVVVMLLMSALQGKTSDFNVLAMSKDSTWVYQISRILEIALRVAVEMGLDTTDQVKTACVVLLETFTTRERYIAAGAQDTDIALPRLLQQLAQMKGFGTFDALRRLVLHPVKNTDRVASIVTSLAVRSLEPLLRDLSSAFTTSDFDASKYPVLVQFAKKILLTPNSLASPLIQSMSQDLSTTSEQDKSQASKFWAAALCAVRTRQGGSPILSWAESVIAIGNVLDLFTRVSFSSDVVEVGTIMVSSIISKTHIQWAFDVAPQTSSMVAAATDDVDMDEDEPSSNTVQAQIFGESLDEEAEQAQALHGAVFLSTWQHAIKTQWKQLYDATFVHHLFSALRDDVSLRQICAVYTTFLLGLGRTHLLAVRQSFRLPPPAFTTYLSAVSAEPIEVAKRVWNLVKHSITSKSTATERVSDAVLQPLLFFNVIYGHMLLTLDDETFYDRAWPFQLGDVRDVVGFLKQFVYDVCWNANVSSRSASDPSKGPHISKYLFPALTTSVKLFNQLYDRDCRRRFSTEGAWLWPSMPIIRETVDLESMEGDLFEVQALSSLMAPGGSLSQHSRASLVLTTIPQVFSFTDRVQLFEKLLDEEKQNLGHVRDEFSRAIQVRVKRDEIVDDSFELFQKICDTMSPSALKSRIKVTFVNEQGLEEAGIDGGGVFKEYIDQLTRSAFSPEYGFFLATNEQLLYPNPSARLIVESSKEVTDRFRFLGRVLGKAVYEEILVEPQFAAFFLNKLLGKFNYIDDLHSLDPDLYRNLMQLKHYKGNVEDLSLTFSVSEMEFGQVVTRHLIPDGANVPVTNENRIRYIHLLANYKLNVLSSHESAAFLRGFRDLVPAKWIQMFSPSELQMLIGGTANKIDIQDWQRHTAYGGGYHPSQRPIQWFWDIVENDFTVEDRAALLKFITSVSRQPLLGFGQLAPQICIHQVRIDDDERLPSSATCMNLLKLPTYSSREIMKQKLLYAIRANAGFDLS